jgi:peptidoglycan-associated lipoprotein
MEVREGRVGRQVMSIDCQTREKGAMGMRNRGWLAIALITISLVLLVTASCSKKAVRTQTQTQTPVQAQAPAPQGQPQTQAKPVLTSEPEVRKAPERSAEKAEPAGRPEEGRKRAEASAREAADWVFLNEHVNFAFNSSQLSDQARHILKAKAEYLRTNPDKKVTVEGHCDDRGTNSYNIALGGRRAESVKTYLVDLGIGTTRLNTASYGEDRPIAVGHDESSWSRNRRAQFLVN